MPCTLQPWEIDYEEKAANKRSFGRELTDASLFEEIACAACRHLENTGELKTAPPIVKKWYRLHSKNDKAAGR